MAGRKLAANAERRSKAPLEGDLRERPGHAICRKPSLGEPVRTRYITLEEVLDPAGNPIRLEIYGRLFDDSVDETLSAGTIEDWSFVNISADTHPIHMHLTNFQVMGRTPLDGLG